MDGKRDESADKSDGPLENSTTEEKLRKLKELINEGMDDLRAGRVTKINSAEEFCEEIKREGRLRRKKAEEEKVSGNLC